MALVEERKPKLSRRKKAKAKRSLETVLDAVVTGIQNDPFLRNHLFLKKARDGALTIGHYKIVRNDLGLYDVYERQELVYRNLYVFDAAMALVENLNTNKKKFVAMILDAEETYVRNINDMRFFKHLLMTTKENHEVYEDRYQLVRQRAEVALETIKKFRLVK